VQLGETVSGLVVDRVSDVLEVESGSFQSPEGGESRPTMCRGVCRVKDELMLVIDLDAVLRPDEHALLAGVV
jgi:chemotaxis signal transduction protein